MKNLHWRKTRASRGCVMADCWCCVVCVVVFVLVLQSDQEEGSISVQDGMSSSNHKRGDSRFGCALVEVTCGVVLGEC